MSRLNIGLIEWHLLGNNLALFLELNTKIVILWAREEQKRQNTAVIRHIYVLGLKIATFRWPKNSLRKIKLFGQNNIVILIVK